MKVCYGIAIGLFVLLSVGAWDVMAYEVYSDGCNAQNCHGDFTASNYVSNSDGQAWGTSLHNGHRSNMLSLDCDVCHTGSSRTPVFLATSNGGSGLPAISCLGCHGRDEGVTGISAAGLRQHHWNNGVTVCFGCHTDANPSNFTPVEEIVLPPYYENPGTGHPNMPKQPCNLEGFNYDEDVLHAPGTGGLDNDGDNLYDTDDPSCAPLTPAEQTTWGQIKALYN